MKNISISFVSVQREIQFTRRKIRVHCGGGIRGVFLWREPLESLENGINGNQFLSVPDDSNVPPSECHNLHGACVAEGDWIFPHLRRSHAEDLAVSKNNAPLGTLLTLILRYAPRAKIRRRLLCNAAGEIHDSTRVRKITRLYVLIPLLDPQITETPGVFQVLHVLRVASPSRFV